MNVDNINVLALAYLGDAIYEERVREYLIRSGISLVDDLQKETIRYVSARNQAKIISYLINTKYLTDREKEVLMLRFGLKEDRKEYTLEEIGQKYGITRERVRQIEIKARKKLRFNDKNTGLKDFLR